MNKSTVVCAIMGGLAAITLALAQDARADESSYINIVADHGVAVSQATLALGHAVCSDISTSGVAGVEADAKAAAAAGVSAHDAAVIIVTAVYELCPSNHASLNAWLYPTSQA